MNIKEKVMQQVEMIVDLTIDGNKHEEEISKETGLPGYAIKGVQSLISKHQKEQDYTKIAEFREIYESGGINMAHISFKTGYSISTVSKVLKEIGVDVSSSRGKASSIEATKEEVEELYLNQGKSLVELSVELGVSVPVVRRFLDENSIGVRTKGRPKKEQNKEFKDTQTESKDVGLMNVKELRDALAELEQSIDGTRDELIERLLEAQ